MTGPLVAWLAARRPEPLERAAAVLLPKDAVRAAIVPTGRSAGHDRSDASASLLWDIVADARSVPACAAAGIDHRLLPAVRYHERLYGGTGSANAWYRWEVRPPESTSAPAIRAVRNRAERWLDSTGSPPTSGR